MCDYDNMWLITFNNCLFFKWLWQRHLLHSLIMTYMVQDLWWYFNVIWMSMMHDLIFIIWYVLWNYFKIRFYEFLNAQCVDGPFCKLFFESILNFPRPISGKKKCRIFSYIFNTLKITQIWVVSYEICPKYQTSRRGTGKTDF